MGKSKWLTNKNIENVDVRRLGNTLGLEYSAHLYELDNSNPVSLGKKLCHWCFVMNIH